MKKIFILTLLSLSYMASADVEICTIPLPVTGSTVVNKLLLGTKHVYLKIDGKTYGMPYTAKKTYFGGDAYLQTEDPFRGKYGKGEKCKSVTISDERDQVEFKQKLKCIADKMAIPLDPTIEQLAQRDWYPRFDYHVFGNNCSSMVSYLLTCAGEDVNLHFNFGVGDEVPMSKEAKIVYSTNDPKLKTVKYSSYGEICQMALDECP